MGKNDNELKLPDVVSKNMRYIAFYKKANIRNESSLYLVEAADSYSDPQPSEPTRQARAVTL